MEGAATTKASKGEEKVEASSPSAAVVIEDGAPELKIGGSPTPEMAVAMRGDAKRGFVTDVFDRLAGRYDAMNLIISVGQTSLWRLRALKHVSLRGGERLLDVGCGTGWVVRYFSKRQPAAELEGMDLSPGMISEAQSRDGENVYFVGDVTAIPREEGSFDLVTTVFTLRNFPDLDSSLREMVRVLKVGGRLMILDSFPPHGPKLYQWFHALWMRRVVPLLVRPFADPQSFRYLAESILRHVEPEDVAARLEGMGCQIERLERYGFGAAAAIIVQRKR